MRFFRLTIAALLASLLALTSARAGAAKPEATTRFVYKKTPQAALEMVVHFPPDWKAGDKRPAIVFFFGGGWNAGTLMQFEPQAKYLAERGMVAARADYRVKSRHGVRPDQCVADARSAVRWLRQHAAKLGIDPEKIVAAGGSAGGHLAACTAVAEGPENEGEDLKVLCRPNALVLFNPVLRFTGIPPLMQRIDGEVALGIQLSPTLHLSKDAPPALVLYGTKDELKAHGDEYVKRSRVVGHRAELYTAEGQSHGFFNRSPWQERTLQRVHEFLSSLGYLRSGAAVKEP